MGLKDSGLNDLAETGNVAQFVSFSPGDATLRFHRLYGDPSLRADDLPGAIAALKHVSRAETVNIRSFREDRDKGCPFYYGLNDVDETAAKVEELAADGYYTIVNETIDIHDGGVSGVVLGGLVEFAPDDTPRAVEHGEVARIPLNLAKQVLGEVYGFMPEIETAETSRLEFSVHPQRVGYRQSHTIWWELELDALHSPLSWERQTWPNPFSRHIGDKAYGLLMAYTSGMRVPETTVIARRVAPFRFGTPTGSGESWIRTCPTEQAPGRFSTFDRWVDPFALLAKEDPEGQAITSVLAQEGVCPRWSGASLPRSDSDEDLVQGVSGAGDKFMLGQRSPETLPQFVIDDVRQVAQDARSTFGPVRIEWVHDGECVWVVQLHLAKDFAGAEDVLSSGNPDGWLDFDVSLGLDALRPLIDEAVRNRLGIRVRGNIGITSHVGDLLRRARVPGRLVREET